jgi:hypothetical protein
MKQRAMKECIVDVYQSMTCIIVPQVDRDFEWDRTKSDRNHLQHGLPFELAVMLFDPRKT